MPDGIVLQHGVRLTVDRDKAVVPIFVRCLPEAMPSGRCVGHDYEIGPDLINRMKNGQVLTVAAIKKKGHHIKMRIDLEDFARAYDGPPTELGSESQKPIRDDRVLPQQLRR